MSASEPRPCRSRVRLKVAQGKALQENLARSGPGPVGKRRGGETLQGKIEELEKQREMQKAVLEARSLDLKRRKPRGGSTAGTDPGAGRSVGLC